MVHGKGAGANSMTGIERKRRDKRIVRQRSRGATLREIAENEGITVNGAFLALKRLAPQVLTALRRNSYDFEDAVKEMVEMTVANETRLFVIDGKIVSHEVPDNATRLRARTRLLNLHVGSDIGSVPAEQKPQQPMSWS